MTVLLMPGVEYPEYGLAGWTPELALLAILFLVWLLSASVLGSIVWYEFLVWIEVEER